MIGCLRRLMLFCLVLVGLAAGLVFFCYRHEQNRDPMPLLDRGLVSCRVVREDALAVITQSGEPRLVRDVTLDGGQAGLIRFTVSLPKEAPGKRLPTLVILGGLESGQTSLSCIPSQGRTALVAYQYPVSREPWYAGSWARKFPEARRAVLDVPAQVEAVLAWVQAQPWADQGHVSLLGCRFGAIVLPSVQHVAAAHGQHLGPTVLAYGGVDIPELLMANLALRPRWLRRLLVELLAVSIRPVEPALHLPHLQGEFLIINGQRDIQIPAASALALQGLAPGPKTVVWLEAGHLHPGNPDLLAEILRSSRQWLLQRKAMAE